MAQLISYQGVTPTIESGCFIAPGAYLIGRVRLLEGSSVWYHAVLRGDVNDIVIGRFSNIQDNATVHVDSGRSGLAPHGLPTIVGDYVTVGHNCVLHACTVEDGCLIGMGAIVLDGAVIGRGSIVGAGAVVTKGTIIPPFSVVLGTPAHVVKVLPPDSFDARMAQAQQYHRLACESQDSILG